MFGAPGYDIATAMQPGLVSILDASSLYHAPRLYGALMLYLLRDLARRLPEAGDLDRPRLVLVFDEAHCLFHEASPALLRSIEATARLIRSKGVGLIWASQSPQDIPGIVRDQCATIITHSRDYGVGRAMFQTLDNQGQPTPPRIISPDLPTCPLGALQSHDAPPGPNAPQEVTNGDWLGYAAIAGFAALIAGALALILGGYAGHMIAGAIALAIFMRV